MNLQKREWQKRDISHPFFFNNKEGSTDKQNDKEEQGRKNESALSLIKDGAIHISKQDMSMVGLTTNTHAQRSQLTPIMATKILETHGWQWTKIERVEASRS